MSFSIPTNSSLNMFSTWGLSSLAIADGATQNRLKNNTNTRILDEGSIFAAIHRHLPQINYSHLKDDKFLGSGSTFHVNRAIYDDKVEPQQTWLVAVKYLHFERAKSRERTMKALMRELSVLTHPFLRGHPHILAALGYGWAEPGANFIRPFLVFPYADYGTLSELLKAHNLHRDITLLEQHSLTLDVALGLKALHDSGFVHGDLKADNVLMFTRTEPLGYTHGFYEISWVAKIADFGSTFTKKDIEEGTARYLGTDIYNAPEIQQDEARPPAVEDDYALYKMADIYSYGLLVWEIMINGLSYLESLRDVDIQSTQRQWKDYVQKKHEEPGDGLAEVAMRASRERAVEAADDPMFQSIEAVLKGSLKKTATERLPLTKTIAALEAVSRGDRPPVVHSLPQLRSCPPQKISHEKESQRYPYAPLNSAHTRLISQTYSHQSRTWSNRNHHHLHYNNTSPESANWHVIPRHRLDGRNVDQIADNLSRSFTIQRCIPLTQTPWRVKEDLVETWNELCRPENDTEVVSEAMIELSIAYHLGFGVEPNQQEAMRRLREAAQGNKTAKCIVARVSTALRNYEGSDPITEEAFHYLAGRLQSSPLRTITVSTSLRYTQISSRPDLEDFRTKSQTLLDLLDVAPRDLGVEYIGVHLLQELWDTSNLSQSVGECPNQRGLCASLTEACRLAATNASRNLAKLCSVYIGRFGDPTPLHWLVTFPFAEAQELFQLLFHGKAGASQRRQGPCYRCLNARTSSSLFVPELRMELLGTPLHWAVRSRNSRLVKLLLDAGADPNIRFKLRPQAVGEPPNPTNIDYSPLELAIELHLFEIVDMILVRLHHIDASDPPQIGTALLAATTTPFARYFIHGSSFRLALRETIKVLLSHGIPLGSKDRFGHVPLLLALRVNSEERYIIEELLRLTVRMIQPASLNGDNLATLVVCSAETDHASTAWKLEQILPYVPDVNAPDNVGFNALHYCALVDNAPMARVLLIQEGIDIERASKKPGYAHTPLLIAAQFGRAKLVRLLIEFGADLEYPTENGVTALELAVAGRHFDAATLLIEAGASLLFGVSGSMVRSSVLHAACLQASNRPPMVRQLLEKHPKLRDKSIVNQFCTSSVDCSPWTPLHQAVQYADLDSVEALLEVQADPDLWRAPSSHIGSSEERCYKLTPKDMATLFLNRAARGALDRDQLKVARVGQPELMRHIEHVSKETKRQERLDLEDFWSSLPFEFRLEDVRTEKEGQAGTRIFIRQLERIKHLMEQATDRGLV